MPMVAVQQASATARSVAGLKRREFFAEIVEQLRRTLAPEFATFRDRVNPLMLKVDFGNERVHFEVWPDTIRHHIEIGLHFEDGPASTAAYLSFFDQHIVEIKHLLGPTIELERWTLSWGHLFELQPLRTLDRACARDVAGRLAAQITLLQPMVLDAAVPPEPRDRAAGGSGRWSRRPRH